MLTFNTLEEALINELADLYSAETQIANNLPNPHASQHAGSNTRKVLANQA